MRQKPYTARQIADVIDVSIDYYGMLFYLTEHSTGLNNAGKVLDLFQFSHRNWAEAKLPKKDGSEYVIPFVHLTMVGENSQIAAMQSDIRAMLLYPAIVLIGDCLAVSNMYDSTPEMRFFKQLRHALAHGNKWHFRRGMPKGVHTFKQFTLHSSLKGHAVLFDYMEAGDVLELLEHVRDQLRAKGGP